MIIKINSDIFELDDDLVIAKCREPSITTEEITEFIELNGNDVAGLLNKDELIGQKINDR